MKMNGTSVMRISSLAIVVLCCVCLLVSFFGEVEWI